MWHSQQLLFNSYWKIVTHNKVIKFYKNDPDMLPSVYETGYPLQWAHTKTCDTGISWKLCEVCDTWEQLCILKTVYTVSLWP